MRAFRWVWFIVFMMPSIGLMCLACMWGNQAETVGDLMKRIASEDFEP